jgi:hypothetical protein
MEKVQGRAQLIADFNTELAAQVRQLQHSGAAAPSPRMAYLDFFADLCKGSDNSARATHSGPGRAFMLHADYTLEGMHLNTKYIPFIEREMEKALDEDLQQQLAAEKQFTEA